MTSRSGEVYPHVLELVQRQLGQFGRVGATRIITVPDVDALAAGASVRSAPVPVDWRDAGWVLAMYGQEVAGTAPKFASTRMRVQIGGSEDLFTDGRAGTYCSFLSLFGGAQNWFPLIRRCQPGIPWLVTYENRDGGATATPSAQFAVILDPDVERIARSLGV